MRYVLRVWLPAPALAGIGLLAILNCYMEVAVAGFISLRSLGHSILALSLAAGAAGCSDVLTYADASREEGISLYKQGQYDAAAGSFKNATKQNPRDYESFYWLGVSYDASKNYSQAINAYKTSLDVQKLTLDGRHDVTSRRRTLEGLAIAISKSPGRAQEIQQIEQKNSGRESAEDALLLAKIFRYSGDADGAIECYNRAVLLDPDDAAISREAGLYFEQIGRTQHAEPLLKRAYNANPSDEPVVAALRRIGIVPGPSLKNQEQLVKPGVPLGPIPEFGAAKPTATSSAQVQTPRD